MTVVIGTAGHIDHGKTTLLRALTGTDADRLPEEQRRGLTIDVGYAHAAPDEGPEIDFVDVPGHDKLVGNMLVGAGEIDACLLVVAADDGPRAQTWEHLGLLDALGLEHGLVAVTKTDLVDAARVGAVTAEVRQRLAETTLAQAPIVAVSATMGDGLGTLRARLAELRDLVSIGVDRRPGPWLAIDRVFSVRGRGVVVTGSSRGGRIESGEVLTVRPGDTKVRIRGLQVHDAPVEHGPLGGRLAINVLGAGSSALRRGHVLAVDVAARDPLALVSSDRLLVALRRPARLPGRRPDDPWPPADGSELRVHIGTDQVVASLGRAGRDAIDLPDGRAVAMLRLDHEVAAAIGDRFVLRRPPPAGLLAGGVVLDTMATRGRSRRRQTPERVAALASAVDARDRDEMLAALLALHGLLRQVDGPRLAGDIGHAASSSALQQVGDYLATHPERPGLSIAMVRSAAENTIRERVSTNKADAETAAAEVVDDLVSAGELVRDGDDVRTPDHVPPSRDPEIDAAMDRLEQMVDVAAPPSLQAAASSAGCPPAGVRELEESGRIVIVADDLAWSAAAYADLSARALDLAATAPLTPAALRDATGTSRKYVMALLEDLDRSGILSRTAAGHVRGPRA